MARPRPGRQAVQGGAAGSPQLPGVEPDSSLIVRRPPAGGARSPAPTRRPPPGSRPCAHRAPGGGPAGAPGVPAEAYRDPQHPDRAERRMLDGGQVPFWRAWGSTSISGTERTRVQGTSASAKRASHSAAVRAGEALGDRADQLRLVRVAADHGPEARIVEPRLEAERPAEPRPELRQLHVEIEVAVPRGVDPRHAVAEEVPDRLRGLGGLGPEGPAGLHREDAVEERGLDPLARAGLAAGDQREQDAGDGQAARCSSRRGSRARAPARSSSAAPCSHARPP